MAEQAVEPAATLRRADLARVGRAHGGYPVGEGQAALDERQAAVELEPVERPQVGGELERPQQPVVEQALVGEVVDREHGRRPRPLARE
jgi:hypothetical protein